MYIHLRQRKGQQPIALTETVSLIVTVIDFVELAFYLQEHLLH